MSVIVYDHPLSPYGQKVKIALIEKGVSFEAPMPDGIGAGSSVSDFLQASPRGEVPALVEGDDVRVFDSTVILEYIEDRWPDPPMLPAGPLERARVRMLEDTMDTHYEAINWGIQEIRFFGRATGELAANIEAKAAGQIKGWYQWLDSQLENRSWFNGEQFGWGDLSVVPHLNGSRWFGFEPEGRLLEWLERVNERDSVAQVREAAQQVRFDGPNSNIEALQQAVAAGAFKREYRDHRLEWMIKSGGLSVVEEGLSKNNIRFIDVFS